VCSSRCTHLFGIQHKCCQHTAVTQHAGSMSIVNGSWQQACEISWLFHTNSSARPAGLVNSGLVAIRQGNWQPVPLLACCDRLFLSHKHTLTQAKLVPGSGQSGWCV
jgi:DNA-directed RNA polymerase subunit N (RpoN/RPB10)